MRPRRTLHIKLLRDLWRLRAQALAIALVMAAGVAMVVMSFGMIRSLEAARTAYYDRYRFADIFASVRRAPEPTMASIRSISGVAVAESRITAPSILDITGISEPVTARILSLPDRGEPALNAVVLRSGRFPLAGRGNEVIVSEAFATAARIEQGNSILALVYGKRVNLRVVGTGISPEYVYAVAPGQIFPDNRRFGILWMRREALAGALNLNQAFNDVAIARAPGANQAELVRRVDLVLAPFGGVGAYGRDLQISNQFVTNEIGQLRTMAEILPPVFLGIAAFLLNIVLNRLIDTEREVIGLMKAFGYRDVDIIVHYAQLAVVLSLAGLILGLALGSWLGQALAVMYQRFFVFPFLEFNAGIDVYVIAVAVTLGAALVGAATAVRRAARLTPAEAMRPPTPIDYSARRLLNWTARHAPDEPSRMIVRALLRRPMRSTLAITGLAAALSIYIASASATDNVDRMISLAFDRADRADLTVSFAEPRGEDAFHALARLPGVIRAEPFRAVSARLTAGPREVREALVAVDGRNDLHRIVDLNGKVLALPENGVLLTARLAKRLGVGPGDQFTAEITEGRHQRLDLTVAVIADSPLGSGVYLTRGRLNRMLGEGATISGAYLEVDSQHLDALYRSLAATPMVAGVTVRKAMKRSIRDTVAENMGIVTLFNLGLAGLAVLGVVYNSARISLSERSRDLASLRVLGFRRSEVGFVLLGEQAVLVLASLPFGILIGIVLSRYITEQFSADFYTIPFGVSLGTLARAVLAMGAAATLTAIIIRTRVDRLDLVRALKTRE